MPAQPSQVGRWGISEGLRAFVEEVPYERKPILSYVREIASSLVSGAVVLDVEAAEAPYRELFEHCEYLTTEWGGYVSGQIRQADFVASADALPLADATADAVLLTQVLDRVPDPEAVLDEAARVLRCNGGVFVTVPFTRALERGQSDLWRFTPSSLERLMAKSGFAAVEVKPLCDCFTTAAQLLHSLGSTMGRTADGRDGERDQAAALLAQLAGRIAALAPLDAAGSLPLGWTATARRI